MDAVMTRTFPVCEKFQTVWLTILEEQYSTQFLLKAMRVSCFQRNSGEGEKHAHILYIYFIIKLYVYQMYIKYKHTPLNLNRLL